MAEVVNWIQVKSCILCIKKLMLKARQTNPGSPPELIRQYQVIENILHLYSQFPLPNDNYFIRNIPKALGFSIADSWTNVKKLLKRKT